MCVNRCICADVSFRDLIDLANRESLTMDELRARTGAGAGCAMCAPYLRAALRTGRDSFPVLTEAELDALPGKPTSQDD